MSLVLKLDILILIIHIQVLGDVGASSCRVQAALRASPA